MCFPVIQIDVADYCEKISTDISLVTDVYEHALMAVVPRPRYLFGIASHWVWLIQFMPEWMSDWLLALKRAVPLAARV